MNEAGYFLIAFISGFALGTIFFGGLWLTVKKATISKQPALWFLASSVLRLIIVLTGFYFVANGNWQRLLICLAAFIIARFVVIKITKSFDMKHLSSISLYQK